MAQHLFLLSAIVEHQEGREIMRQSIFDYVGNLDTLIAVIVGALLATTGALLAELIQDRLNRKRRERDAARFFGEILASIDRVVDFALDSQTIGDEWGPVTQRLFKTAMREAGVYERNRERLFDIQDTELRARIHTHFLTETFPIEAILDGSEKIEQAQKNQLPSSKFSDEQMKTELEELHLGRQRGVKALRREHAKTREICDDLEKIAGVKFNYYENMVSSPTENFNDESV